MGVLPVPSELFVIGRSPFGEVRLYLQPSYCAGYGASHVRHFCSQLATHTLEIIVLKSPVREERALIGCF